MLMEAVVNLTTPLPADGSVMGPMQDGAVQLLFRWIHIVAGVLWIGLLYFLNWVNAVVEPKFDPDTKKKLALEMRPRVLFFFRWGAAYTWITGLLLLLLIYYHSKSGTLNANFWGERADGLSGETKGKAYLALGLVLALFLVYDVVAKALAKSPLVGVCVWFAIAVGYAALLEHWLGASSRAIFIHVGSLFGTAMAGNVWMRIWPSQKKIMTAIKGGTAPDAALVALAGLRSKQNTFMSVPLLLLMVSVHQTYMLGVASPTLVLAAILAISFLATHWIYKTAAKVPAF
jgi:uncharacterized membrane protein